jgi:hypothetical protein
MQKHAGALRASVKQREGARTIGKAASGAALTPIATILVKLKRSNFTQYLFELIGAIRALLICLYFKLQQRT